MSGYGRLRRGPMGADILGQQFNQTYNGLWRDPRLTPKAMGVFGNISSHRDGYGLSAKAISKQMKAGVSMIKAALVELEEVGYLYRLQLRNGDGTVGDTLYFITDIPDHVDIAEHARQSYAQSGATKTAMVITKQSRRSAPVIENPPADKPPSDNHPPKKTNYKNTTTEDREGEEGAPAREIDSPTTGNTTTNDDNGGDEWGIAPTQRPTAEQGTLLARTVITQIAEETGLGLEPWQHKRLVLEHVPTALAAVKNLGDDAISGTEFLEWLRADHDTTMSLYAVLSRRCAPDYLCQALPVWVARTRTPGGLPAPSKPTPDRPRTEAPDGAPDPFSAAGAPPTCTVHPGIALTADATGQRNRCHQCEAPPAPAPPVEDTLEPSPNGLVDVLDQALPDTEPDITDHCGNRSCHEHRRHIIRFNPTTQNFQDLGPCPQCHPDHTQEPR